MRSTSGSVLVDTNLFVYRLDLRDPARQARAVAQVERLGDRVVVSTQVLLETHNVLVRKLPAQIPRERALAYVRDLAAAYPVLPVTVAVVAEALTGIERFGFSTWDAQLWATAKVHGIPGILTEDRQCVGVADGVRFVDPFA